MTPFPFPPTPEEILAMRRQQRSRFQHGSGVYTCRTCGKRTRDTGNDEAGVRLCRKCFDEATIENEINDGYRDKDGKWIG